VRSKTADRKIRVLKLAAHALSTIRAEQRFEGCVEKLLLGYPRSKEARQRLLANRPAVLVTTGPFQFEQPAIVAEAKNLGIPVIALIPSWDNISTKNRMVFKYDGYIVWSQRMREELREYYPESRGAPVYVVGAPQFDVFFQERFSLSRRAFCATQGLRDDLPIIVFALGSPNMFQEHHGALFLAHKLAEGALGEAQLIVRPHPIHDRNQLANMFATLGPRVVLQQCSDPSLSLTARTQDEDQVTEWVNTFRHADVVVNLASTVTIDAAIFDRPVVNLDYDPEPGHPRRELVDDVNHVWTHFKAVAESGGVYLVKSDHEMVQAVKDYLANPALHQSERRQVAQYVCECLDGRSGERLADSILDFLAVMEAGQSQFTR